MSARKYSANTANANRSNSNNIWNVFRDPRRYLEVHSSDLSCMGVLQHLPPLGRKKSWPHIMVIGDGASLADDTLRCMQDLYLYGVLGAAHVSQAHIVDTGLASHITVVSPPENRSDFCRDICQIGILPSGVKESISKYHTHQIILSDFLGWEDRPSEFVKVKFEFLRRLVGDKCRAVSILFNSGHAAFEEVEESCRLGIPCIVMKGSGALANELCKALENVNDVADERLKNIVDSGCLYPFDATITSDSGLKKTQQVSALAALVRFHLLIDSVNLTRTMVGGKSKRMDPILNSPVWFVRGNPTSHVKTQVGKGKLLAQRGQGGQQRKGGKRKRGVGHRTGKRQSNLGKIVVNPGMRKKPGKTKSAYSTRFGFTESVPRPPNAEKEWWEMTDKERAEQLEKEQRDRKLLYGTRKVARKAAEAHCHKHLVERAAVAAARRFGASEEVARRLGMEEAEAAMAKERTRAIKKAVDAPESLSVQSPLKSIDERKRRKTVKRIAKQSKDLSLKILNKQLTLDEQIGLDGAYRIARAVLAGGGKPEKIGRAAREAVKYVGEETAVVLGAEAGGNVVAEEATVHGESVASIRVKTRRAVLGAGVDPGEAVNMSTRIVIQTRAKDAARRATEMAITRGEDPKTVGVHAFDAVHKVFPDTLSDDVAHHIAGTVTCKFIGEKCISSGETIEESFIAAKIGAMGAGMDKDVVDEHVKNILPRLVGMFSAKEAAKKALATGMSPEETGTVAVEAAKSAIAEAMSVLQVSDKAREMFMAATVSIGSHAAAEEVAYHAASSGHEPDAIHSVAVKAAQGAGMHEGDSHSIAAHSVSIAPTAVSASTVSKDAATKAINAGLEPYQIGMVAVSAARIGGLSELEAQRVGISLAEDVIRENGSKFNKDSNQVMNEIDEAGRGGSLTSYTCDVVVFRCNVHDSCCQLDSGRVDNRGSWGDGLEVWWEGRTIQDVKQHYIDAHPKQDFKYVKTRCGFQCASKRQLREHAAKAHYGLHVCMYTYPEAEGGHFCGEIFPSGWMLASHLVEDHINDDYAYECDALVQPDKDLKSLVEDASKEAEDEETIAEIVSDQFAPAFRQRIKNTLLDLNEDEDENGNRYDCADAYTEMCMERFKTRGAMEAHRRKAHPRPGGKFWCEKCPFSSKSAMELKIHIRSAHSNYLYKCNAPGIVGDQCKRVFNSEAKRDSHVKNDHALINRKTGDVSYVGSNAYSAVKKRVRSTKGLTECGMCFHEEADLLSHVSLTHKEKFFCNTPSSHPACKLCCTSVDELVLHSKAVHPKFPCTCCEKIFDSEVERQIHLKKDHRKLEECHYCHQKFSNHDLVMQHEERRHTCEHCEFRCCASWEMDLHLASSHSKFRCNLCSALCDSRHDAKHHHTICQVENSRKVAEDAKKNVDAIAILKDKEEAATQIEANVRGTQKTDIKGTKEEEAAAIKIEARIRGRKDRERVKKMREQQAKLPDGKDKQEEKPDIKGTKEEEAAAIKIEARIRGRKDRERVKKMREEQAKQPDGKDKQEEEPDIKGTKEEEAAAIKIEARIRGRKDRERVKKMREQQAKATLSDGEDKLENEAASVIQARVRGSEDRSRYESMKAEKKAKEAKAAQAENARIEAAKKRAAAGPQPPRCVAGHNMAVKSFDSKFTCDICCEEIKQGSSSDAWYCEVCNGLSDAFSSQFCFKCCPKEGTDVWIKGSTCSVPEDFATVDEALAKAKMSGGDIKKILVGKGVHKVGTTNCGSQQKTPCLCIWKVKGIHIKGAGIGKTVLEGLVHCKNDKVKRDGGLESELRLESLTITNKRGSGLWIGKKGASMKCVDVELAACKANGVLVDGAESRLVRCAFEKNGRNGCLVSGGTANLTSCTAINQGDSGVRFDGGATGKITKLKATENKATNLVASGLGTMVTARGLELRKSKGHGASALGGALLVVKGHKTRIVANSKHACYSEGKGSTITLEFRKGHDHSENVIKWVHDNKFQNQFGVRDGGCVEDTSGKLCLRGKSSADMETVLPTCVKGHELILQDSKTGTSKSWSCSADGTSEGCKVLNDVSEKKQWRCEECDFNYCGPCFNSRITERKKRSYVRKKKGKKGK